MSIALSVIFGLGFALIGWAVEEAFAVEFSNWFFVGAGCLGAGFGIGFMHGR